MTDRRNRLAAALAEYSRYLAETKKPSQRVADSLFKVAEAIVPDAILNDLYFYGERERSDDEVASEATLRQDIYDRDGEYALLVYILEQNRAACLSDDIAEIHQANAQQTVEEVEARLALLRS